MELKIYSQSNFKIMSNHEKRLVPFISNDGKSFISKKVGRNQKCECGSGLKQKKCCGIQTKYYVKQI